MPTGMWPLRAFSLSAGRRERVAIAEQSGAKGPLARILATDDMPSLSEGVGVVPSAPNRSLGVRPESMMSFRPSGMFLSEPLARARTAKNPSAFCSEPTVGHSNIAADTDLFRLREARQNSEFHMAINSGCSSGGFVHPASEDSEESETERFSKGLAGSLSCRAGACNPEVKSPEKKRWDSKVKKVGSGRFSSEVTTHVGSEGSDESETETLATLCASRAPSERPSIASLPGNAKSKERTPNAGRRAKRFFILTRPSVRMELGGQRMGGAAPLLPEQSNEPPLRIASMTPAPSAAGGSSLRSFSGVAPRSRSGHANVAGAEAVPTAPVRSRRRSSTDAPLSHAAGRTSTEACPSFLPELGPLVQGRAYTAGHPATVTSKAKSQVCRVQTSSGLPASGMAHTVDVLPDMDAGATSCGEASTMDALPELGELEFTMDALPDLPGKASTMPNLRRAVREDSGKARTVDSLPDLGAIVKDSGAAYTVDASPELGAIVRGLTFSGAGDGDSMEAEERAHVGQDDVRPVSVRRSRRLTAEALTKRGVIFARAPQQ